MNIARIPNILNITNLSTIKHNYFVNNKYTSDVFIKSPSFGSNIKVNENNSFEEFEKWAEETDFYSKAQKIIDETGEILGSGFEGITYSIPNNDKWVIKQYKRTHLVPGNYKEPKITQLVDNCPKLNIGQPIAQVILPMGGRYGNSFLVMKRQSGNSYGVEQSKRDYMFESSIEKHLSSLKQLSEFPQESFDKCIKDIEYITKQGYVLDCCNPYNFMIDDEKQSINFVDVSQRTNSSKIEYEEVLHSLLGDSFEPDSIDNVDEINCDETQYGEVLYALLDGPFGINFANKFPDYDEKKKEAIKYSEIITKKFINAMASNNVNFTNGPLFEEIIKSGILDKFNLSKYIG